MRGRNRRIINEEQESKKILYISASVVAIAIIAFIITFVIYSSKLNSDTQEFGYKITDLASNNNNEISQVSSSIGKTVNEVQENTENEETTKIAINTSNIENKQKQNEVKEETSIENTNKVEEKTSTKEEEKEPKFIKPVEGEIIKEFANEKLVYSETLKEWVTHNGIDIKAEKTTVVKAAEKGSVKFIKNDPRYGITVAIEHTNGYVTIYSNLLTAEFVKEGDKVESGQTIGTVGNTATFEIADEPHLHFELMKDNNYLNPSLYIN